MSDSPTHKRRKIAQASDEELPDAISLFSLLPDDLLDKCFSFVGPGYYRYVGGVCKRFRLVYCHERSNRTNVTLWRNVTASVPCAELCLDDQERLGGTSEEKKDVIATIGSKAVEYGKVEVLAWAHGNGFILNKRLFRKAGRNGHVNVLEWAHSNNLDWHSCNLVYRAAIYGHVNVLDFALNKEPLGFNCNDLTYLACETGRIDVLEWLKGKQLLPSNDDVTKYGMQLAARGGHVAVLDWMYENGYQPPIDLADEAARGGHIDVLQWAQDRGFHGSTDACAYAAIQGRLNALQWLRENDCPWDSRVISYAEVSRHDHIAEWARENGCPEPEEEDDADVVVFL